MQPSEQLREVVGCADVFNGEGQQQRSRGVAQRNLTKRDLLSFHSFQVFVYYGMVKPLPIMLGKAPGKPISPATHPTHLMPYPT
jgi:hypothetical protein